MSRLPTQARVADASNQKRIVVLGHSAYRAGAEMALLHLLRWLTHSYPADFSLLLKTGGELVADYAAVLPTEVNRSSGGLPSYLLKRLPRLRRLARSLRHPAANLPAPIDFTKADLVYCNTAVSLELLPSLPLPRHCPVICHVHELDMSIQRASSLERFKRAQSRIHSYIAVSRAVADNLIGNHQVPPDLIYQIYEGIALPDISQVGQCRRETRDRLRIPPEAFVVGGCGTMDWRKSPELFLQAAQQVARAGAHRPIHFVWVGGRTSGWEVEVLRHDIARMSIQDRVHLVGPQPEPLKHFAAFDAFLLTSREDPFPLVCLEAAALTLPIICFANAGGMPEFVETDAGFVVPYLDIQHAADCVLRLAGSEELRATLGRRAAEKVKSYDVEVIGRQIADVLAAHLR